ncbi:PP2C family protein-serine/threonine phosphatase [Haematomicrobium sanguinis]|uniref:PP2C family protein-serine/threonine phosphatase n=1 Tax=Haematomicrobium sanguinis TaxID=479106 RepID=UPI000689885D|nr:protein phosphatase 2C domain-containing protein [Haematomicrobium sanguinis]
MPLIFRYAARSDVGMVRAKNDDSAYAGAHLAILADGMGGHAGGDVASATTVLELVHLDHDRYADGADIIFADEIQAANSMLRELVSTNPRLSGMGTTLSGLLLTEDKLFLAHIGDSRAYRLKDDEFAQISKDHTFVQMLVDEGRLSPAAAAVHPNKNVVMRVLGDVDASPELDISEFTPQVGEKWFLFSDGVSDVLPDHVIEKVVRDSADLNTAVNRLVDLTLAGGAPDNTTVIAVEVVEATEKDLEDAALAAALSASKDEAPESGQNAESTEAQDGAKHPASPDTETVATGSTTDTRSGVSLSEGFNVNAVEAQAKAQAQSIRRDLASRPHLLVGAAALATETGQIPIVAAKPRHPRAAAVLTHRGPGKAIEPEIFWEEERSVPRKRWVIPAFLTVMILLLSVVAWMGYTWTQTRYYVGEKDGKVAIYKGVSQSLGPIPLSQEYEVENIPVVFLPDYNYQRVKGTIPARDLAHAEQIVGELRDSVRAAGCIPVDVQATERPTDSATSTPSPSPTRSGTSSATGTPSGTPSPGATLQTCAEVSE